MKLNSWTRTYSHDGYIKEKRDARARINDFMQALSNGGYEKYSSSRSRSTALGVPGGAGRPPPAPAARTTTTAAPAAAAR
ncbi:MAG: hypothetical protein LBG05_01075, partial [Treponema sp.]|nr:hypothetical protein [Treponema sp.]